MKPTFTQGRLFKYSYLAIATISWNLLTAAAVGNEKPAQGKAKAVKVQSFSPTGLAKKVGQVKVRFSGDVVRFGDPRAQDPFSFSCDGIKGIPERGRWLDTRNWVLDFGKSDLPAGVRCKFELVKELKTADGLLIEGQSQFSFDSGGPGIVATEPYAEGTLSEDAVVVARLDGLPDLATVTKNAYFQVEGIREPIGVKLIDGEERKSIIRASWNQRYADRVVVLRANQNFPSGAKVTFHWPKGIKTKSGVATTSDQVFKFTVRQPFEIRFSCQRENKDADCLPITPLNVEFSDGVALELAKKVYVELPDGTKRTPNFGDKPDQVQYSAVFKGVWPENTALKVVIPADLVDLGGRQPANGAKFPLAVRTGPFPPLAKFAAQFGVLESGEGGVLPLTVRRLGKDVSLSKTALASAESMASRTLRVDEVEAVLKWKRKVASHDRENSVFAGEAAPKKVELPKRSSLDAFEVIGIPLQKPGFYVVEVESANLGASLLGKLKPMYVPATVLVTNLSVHFKWGAEGSLVWVTSLDKGLPVAGAEVDILDCNLNNVAHGVADKDGILKIEKLPLASKTPYCDRMPSDEFSSGLTIVARKGGDFAFTHSSWNDGLEKWRFRVNSGWEFRPHKISTIFDRTLFRAGETISMKHFVRRLTAQGIHPATSNAFPSELTITHYASDTKYKIPLQWDTSGVAETQWKIPKDAHLGSWSVTFNTNDSFDYGQTGTFRVEEFRLPVLKGVLQGPAADLIRPSELPVDIAISYLSGGGAANLPVKMRYVLNETNGLSFSEFEDFQFNRGAVKVGREGRDYEQNYSSDGSESDLNDEQGGEEPSADGDLSPASNRASGTKIPKAETMTLDPQGTGRFIAKDLKSCLGCSILVEAEYADPSGEVQTLARTFSTYTSSYLVAVQPDNWVSERERLKFKIAVASPKGKAIENAPVEVQLFEREYYSHRKRLVGGFYSYESYSEVRSLGSFCNGKTANNGLLTCEGKPPKSGNLIAQVLTKDSNGMESASFAEVWVPGTDDWWWSAGDSDRIDLLPEKKFYEPGETARLQLRAPFRSGSVLVSIEREGVIKSWVQPLDAKEPVLSIPIEKDWAPNIFVSAFVVRGRTSEHKPTALVDLGRPAFKMGIAELNVGWRAHKLNVTVTPERNLYKVREKAKVKIQVTTALGDTLPPKAEAAVAVVDQALLELKPNDTWDILTEMMSPRRLYVDTATGQMKVIGKRHFGLKALPAGGGGGDQPTRELFDTLLLWKGRVPLSPSGEAEIEVPLNDSLSTFQVVAIASAGFDRFGTGTAAIQTSQDVMLLSGLPPLAREGDVFRATYTLRNTTKKVLNLAVKLIAKPHGAPGALLSIENLKDQTLTLPPGESREVAWDIKIPLGVEKIAYEAEVRGTDGSQSASRQALDRIKNQQKVIPAVRVRTFQATVAQLDTTYSIPVETPKDAEPGRGGLQVSLLPTLAGSLMGVREYMSHYPYSCMEQEVSRAVALRDQKAWKNIVAVLPSYLDGEGLVKFFPVMRHGSDTLTSYLLTISDAAGYAIADDVKSRMVEGLQKFILGKSNQNISTYVRAPDLPFRRLAAMLAVAAQSPRNFKNAWLDTLDINPDLWPTSAVVDWLVLNQKIKTIKNSAENIRKAEAILRTRMTINGTRMDFSTEASDSYWWLMVSGDLNSVRMLHALVESKDWVVDMPRIVRSVIGRQNRHGHWDLTNANAWGVLAIERFSKQFESVAVSGKTSTSLASTTKVVDWKTKSPPPASFPPPAAPATLKIEHSGTGKPWAVVQSQFAIPLAKPLYAGYKVTKEVFAVDQRDKGKWSKGDIARVKIKIESQQEMTWVVLNDPIPAGATILGGGLGRDSNIATASEKKTGNVWSAFEERSFEAFRAYYEWTPKGEWTVEYTMRINNPGQFRLPETRVEAMYAPEIFAELPNSSWEVVP